MSLDSELCGLCCCVWGSGSLGTLVPSVTLLGGVPRGIGGIATKSKTKGGWRHAPCLLGPKNSIKIQHQKHLKKQKHKGNK
jgi:hypothetical protein